MHSGRISTLGSMPGLWGADGAHSILQGTELQPAEQGLFMPNVVTAALAQKAKLWGWGEGGICR